MSPTTDKGPGKAGTTEDLAPWLRHAALIRVYSHDDLAARLERIESHPAHLNALGTQSCRNRTGQAAGAIAERERESVGNDWNRRNRAHPRHESEAAALSVKRRRHSGAGRQHVRRTLFARRKFFLDAHLLQRDVFRQAAFDRIFHFAFDERTRVFVNFLAGNRPR
jgi:hypothetical protein